MIKPNKYLKEIDVYQLDTRDRKNKIRLDLNENTLGCSPKVIEALKNAKIADVAFYPEYDELINKIALRYSILPHNILLTNGGDDAIRCVVETYANPNELALITEPTFSMFEIQLRLCNASIKKIFYKDDFLFPFKDFYASLGKRVKLAVIVNPASPVGTAMDSEQLIKILRRAYENGTAVILDETYYHFNKKTYIKLIEEFDNLIVLQSFSKAYGLAGIRFGFIASNEANIASMHKVSLPYAVNSLAVIAGNIAIDDEEHLNKVVQNVEIEKRYLLRELSMIGLDAINTATNFILVKCSNYCSMFIESLREKNILVKGFPNDRLLKDYIRISIGTHQENEELIKALRQIINRT